LRPLERTIVLHTEPISFPKDVKPADRYLVPAVDQASRVLVFLSEVESGYASLTQICAKVGIHKSKAFSILHTLQKFGLVQKGSDGKGYGLGPGLIGLSRRFLDNLRPAKLAESLLETLAKKTGTTAALGLVADKNVFVAAKREGAGPIVVTMRVGHRFPITYGCHGKVIAAFLPPEELKDVLKERKLHFYGDPTQFDKERLMADIERCRKDWFATDTEETAPGLNAVAAPVISPAGRPIGYVVVLGLPSAEAARRYGPDVAEAGKTLSRQLGARVV
jgi:DNA-binding IclR family transcriptional regulator